MGEKGEIFMLNGRYRNFYELCDELISQGKRFDEKSLKLLTFIDLNLADIGNAGKAACSFELVKAEQKMRIDAVIDISTKKVEEDKGKWNILDDITMYYAYYQEKANRIGPILLYKAPRWRLLTEEMRNLRGNWSGGRSNEHLARIYVLLPEVEAEGVVPLEWCKAVKMNADTFDGEFNDGRIMRDGRMRLPEDVAKEFGLPSSDASGNIAKMLGAEIEKRPGGYRGSYEELFEDILDPSQKIVYLQEIEGMSLVM